MLGRINKEAYSRSRNARQGKAKERRANGRKEIREGKYIVGQRWEDNEREKRKAGKGREREQKGGEGKRVREKEGREGKRKKRKTRKGSEGEKGKRRTRAKNK